MKSILKIDSSLFGEHGVSTQLANSLIEQLKIKHPQLSVIQRRFADQAVPHFDASWIQALSTEAEQRSSEQQQKVDYSDSLIDEVKQADALVITLPMYNFNVPSMLKAWFDHIARAGVTFKYTETGPVGLVDDKPVYLITTRGGVHKGAAHDTQIQFVKTFLNFIGLTQTQVVYAEALNMGEQREPSIDTAKQEIAELVKA
ncbi:NAD(P)H-dependent oxidoreductase [Catenovulum sp. 2E275]|uniref:FMN-dependent NADH-azoreductase n=1 Tax=Catenovulum sp. 2E275 TaxID=2980497 RepID=UPI0021D25F8F|nr:NAD(P)H-dependent oxidoreductase [Catenovulum sp. 2E275]MCU4674891.1 NAD(P)H-dependent oxidoreductase [Catenovulum sp. 2E275]